MKSALASRIGVVLVFLLAPAAGLALETSSIAGTVRDPSKAVLPG